MSRINSRSFCWWFVVRGKGISLMFWFWIIPLWLFVGIIVLLYFPLFAASLFFELQLLLLFKHFFVFPNFLGFTVFHNWVLLIKNFLRMRSWWIKTFEQCLLFLRPFHLLVVIVFAFNHGVNFPLSLLRWDLSVVFRSLFGCGFRHLGIWTFQFWRWFLFLFSRLWKFLG